MAVVGHGGGVLLVGVAGAALNAWWLLSIPLSAVIDRRGSGPVLRSIMPLRIGAILVLSLNGLLSDALAIAAIIVGALLFGLTDVITDCAAHAIPALVLADDELDSAYSLMQAAGRVTELVVGPTLGAVLLAVNPGLPFIIVAICVCATFVGYSRYYRHPDTQARRDMVPDESDWSEMFAGVRYIVSNRFLRAVMVTLAGIVIAEEAVSTLVVPYFGQAHGSGWQGLIGLAKGAAGLAAIVAALSAGFLAHRCGRYRTLCIVAGVGAATPAILAISPTLPPLFTALMLSAVAESIWVPLVQGEIARHTPAHLLARTRAALLFVTWGALPITAVLSGALAASLGYRAVLVVATVLAFVACVLGVWRLRGAGT